MQVPEKIQILTRILSNIRENLKTHPESTIKADLKANLIAVGYPAENAEIGADRLIFHAKQAEVKNNGTIKER